MGVFGKFRPVLSDDDRYTVGTEYDLYLATASTPAPASAATGELAPPPVTETVASTTTS